MQSNSRSILAAAIAAILSGATVQAIAQEAEKPKEATQPKEAEAEPAAAE